MTAKGKQIKTKFMMVDTLAVIHATTVDTNISWVPQDDITIIGIQLIAEFNYSPADIAEAGGAYALAEISRAAMFDQDSSMVNSRVNMRWAAAVLVPPIASSRSTVEYPEGYGIDIDDGEAVNLLTRTQSHQAASDTVAGAFRAIISYVEQ